MKNKVIELKNFTEIPKDKEFNNKRPLVDKITVTYDDGTTEEVTKGAVIELTDFEGYTKMDMNFTKMNRYDMITIIQGFSEFVVKSGILEDVMRD